MHGVNGWDFAKMTAGVLGTMGLYSVLYRENRFYRFFEHLFLGLAAGYSIVAFWTEQLKTGWWDLMVGAKPEGGQPGQPGFFLYGLLLPIGLMGYFVFSKRSSWMSRIPIGIILGFWSGQQVQVWWTRYGPQIEDSMRPIFPTTTTAFFKPATEGLAQPLADQINGTVYLSQALTNLIFIVTLLSVLSYFLFSFEVKNKILLKISGTGRILLMIGFGAIFGSTVMMRFALLIDRMNFVWIDWLWKAVLGMKI